MDIGFCGQKNGLPYSSALTRFHYIASSLMLSIGKDAVLCDSIRNLNTISLAMCKIKIFVTGTFRNSNFYIFT